MMNFGGDQCLLLHKSYRALTPVLPIKSSDLMEPLFVFLPMSLYCLLVDVEGKCRLELCSLLLRVRLFEVLLSAAMAMGALDCRRLF